MTKFKCERCSEEFEAVGEVPELEEGQVFVCDDCLKQLFSNGTVH